MSGETVAVPGVHRNHGVMMNTSRSHPARRCLGVATGTSQVSYLFRLFILLEMFIIIGLPLFPAEMLVLKMDGMMMVMTSLLFPLLPL